MRSGPLSVANRSLAQGLDGARRLDALEWLVQAFDALNLPDTQLFAAFGLLDRFAAASPAPISAGPGAFALVLAAMLVALKVSGTQKDLERAKRLVVEVSGNAKPWASVRRAELQILRRLHFRACTPTARDLLDRLLQDAKKWPAAPRAPQDGSTWDDDARTSCENLSKFLLELGLVNDPEAVYGQGRPPLAAALAAFLLSLLALNAPRHCAEALQEPMHLLDTGSADVKELAEAMRQRWTLEERRAAGGGNSAVMEKWLRRVGSLNAAPPAAADLRFLTGGATAPEAPALKDTAPGGSPQLQQRRGSAVPGMAKAAVVGAAETVLASIPTPARGRGGAGAEAPAAVVSAEVPAADRQTATAGGVPAGSSPAAVAPTISEAPLPQHLPTPRTAHGPNGGPAPVQAASKYPPAQLVSQLSRAAATENLSSWPMPGGPEPPPSPPPVKVGPSSTRGAAAAAAAASAVAHGGTAAPPPDRSPEPLVELTHVLNMVVPRPAQGASASHAQAAPPQAGHATGTGKATQPQRPPSVAAELLVSSALRMQWPVDRRKVASADAASTCREAAAVLQEAAAQLTAAAASLDGGAVPVREFNKHPALGSESKRRRTFGGPSPARAFSPAGGGGPPATRGSPPVRFSGLRV